MEHTKDQVISAVSIATVSDVVDLTCDRIEALAGGHGMLNLAIFSVANVVAEELLRGHSMQVKFANERHLPVDDIVEKAVNAAKYAGADGANAALIAASVMYFAGAAAQVGIPAGNRKLGATARMLAGADRCGVSNIPTGKSNSKISGFPAVMAINQAMMDGVLSPINGRNIPSGVFGAVYGHSALGEDYIWPAVAEKGARIGTQAMLDAMAGVGMTAQPLYAAVLGAAAILEIIHPDAEVPEGEGKYGRTTTAYLVGRSAAKTAGLPEKLHMRLTGEEYDTAQVIGDMGLIIKDIGGPSVIGMMAFSEVLQAFRELSSSFHNSPLGHMTPYVVASMKALTNPEVDEVELAQRLVAERQQESLDPESALVCISIVAQKAAELQNGPVTRFLIRATAPTRAKAIYDRATFTYDGLRQGRTLSALVHELDDQRVRQAEIGTSVCFKYKNGENVSVRFTRLENAARRTGKVIHKYFAFDPRIDLDVTVNGKTAHLERFTDQTIPKACQGEIPEVTWAIPYAVPAASELMSAGNNLLNVVVPVAVAAAMDLCSPEDAAAMAEPAAYITCAIPGGKAASIKVARRAQEIIRAYDIKL